MTRKRSESTEMIYIAAPYWHEDETVRDYRRQKAIEYSTTLTKRGIMNYSPLLYTERFNKTRVKERYWIEHGRRMVEACDVVRVLCLDGWQESSGVAGEIEVARRSGKKVEYIEECVSLAFCGSRSLGDKKVKEIIDMEIERHRPEMIVTHGEPAGVCALARAVCQERGIPLKAHYLQLKKAAGKFHHRSVAVFNDCDFCVFIHDGVSKGCHNELELARKMDIPHTYYLLQEGNVVQPEDQDLVWEELEMPDMLDLEE